MDLVDDEDEKRLAKDKKVNYIKIESLDNEKKNEDD